MKSNVLIPTVIESSSSGERVYDIYSRLLKDRIIFVGSEIEPSSANVVVAQLLHLAHEDSDKEIYMYINCPGGEIYSGLAILDTMKYIKPPVATIAVGLAASMAAVLLAAGEKGRRFALPHSKILIHQPSSAFKGTASDIEIDAKETLQLKRKLEELLGDYTGKKPEVVAKDMDRDFYMTSDEAQNYGLIDAVITSASDVKKKSK